VTCGDCGGEFKLVSKGKYQCPCGNWYKVKKKVRKKVKKAKRLTFDYISHDQSHCIHCGCALEECEC
jgi:hypothetical protein